MLPVLLDGQPLLLLFFESLSLKNLFSLKFLLERLLLVVPSFVLVVFLYLLEHLLFLFYFLQNLRPLNFGLVLQISLYLLESLLILSFKAVHFSWD